MILPRTFSHLPFFFPFNAYQNEFFSLLDFSLLCLPLLPAVIVEAGRTSLASLLLHLQLGVEPVARCKRLGKTGQMTE